jgi:acyl-CoA dehydrogenase
MTSALERARAIANTIAAQHANAVDADSRFPFESFSALKQARLLGAFVPRDFGGEGASFSEIAAICNLLGRNCGSTGLIFAMHQIQAAIIVLHGNASRWHHDTLQRLASGQLLIASATTEGATGGDLSRSECAVISDGNRFRLEKYGACISYGDQADMIMVTARRTPAAPPSDQVLAVLQPGQFKLSKTEDWQALGMRGTGSHTYALQATGHTDQILPTAYGDILNDTMTPFAHITWSSVWLGIAEDAVARARTYLRTASGSPAARTRVVEATAALQQMRANIATAVRAYEAKLASSDATVSLPFLQTMNNLKLSVSTGAVQVIQQALMICGLSGYRTDTPASVGRHLRDALSAPLMVSNDRITANMAKMLLLQRSEPDLLTPEAK